MFSDRIPETRGSNPVLRALEARRASGAEILDLTESNPTRAGLRYDERTILQSLARPAGMLYEPDPRGLREARAAVSGYYRGRGIEIDPDSLLLTSGTSEAYGYLFKLLAKPGEEVLVPKPGYPLLEVLTALDGVRLVHYPLRHREGVGWSVDLDRLRDTVSTRTVAIVVVSPNNPTGSFLKARELEHMTELAERFGLTLIVDEVFSDYGAGADPERVASAAGHRGALTFVLNGLSKTAGLPQLKLSWILTSGPSKLEREARERLEFISDAYLSVGSPVQHAAATLFEHGAGLRREILSRIAANESHLASAMGRTECRLLGREGGWYAVVDRSEAVAEGAPEDDELAVVLLEREGVLVHPGYFYDFAAPGYLVVSLLTEPGVFRAGVERLVRALRGPSTSAPRA